ncbi:MAG: hypothetical protein IPO08_17110 [Xanthomonadales bacterium]|nr:hypothetical protein [Xanthomonadales bacterium]
MFSIGMVLTGVAPTVCVDSVGKRKSARTAGGVGVFRGGSKRPVKGVLVPLRETIAGWWTVEGGGSRDLLAILGVGHWGGLAFGLVWGVAALFYAYRAVGSVWQWASAIGAGLMVALAWWATYSIMNNSFEPVRTRASP